MTIASIYLDGGDRYISNGWIKEKQNDTCVYILIKKKFIHESSYTMKQCNLYIYS